MSPAPAPWAGGSITAFASCVLAPNPSPMTLDGTNTWVLARPDATAGVVVDPGPLHEGHLTAVAQEAQRRGIRVEVVLLTHHHADHEEGAQRFAEMVGAHVRGGSHGGLSHGDVVEVDGLRTHVLATPGHTADSVSFLLPEDRSLLTGDTVLGRSTTVVAWPDGELAAYLASLTTLRRAVDDAGVEAILPAHGPIIEAPEQVLAFYERHRHERLEQVRAALAQGARDADEVVAHVYVDVPENVLPAAKLSVQAQLEYLRG